MSLEKKQNYLKLRVLRQIVGPDWLYLIIKPQNKLYLFMYCLVKVLLNTSYSILIRHRNFISNYDFTLCTTTWQLSEQRRSENREQTIGPFCRFVSLVLSFHHFSSFYFSETQKEKPLSSESNSICCNHTCLSSGYWLSG